MQSAMSLLTKYFDEIGEVAVVPIPDEEAPRRLPVFLSQMYQVHRAHLFGRPYSLLLCRGERPTPAEIEKHFKLAESALNREVAFVFLTLPAFDRKRLVQRRIPFLVPGRQSVLPGGLIDLREKAKGGQGLSAEPTERLSAPAQVLILYQLQRKTDADDWPLSKWGNVLGYSRSTLTRVSKALSNASLCSPVASGRQVTLLFPRRSRDLWESALPYLGSPVRRRSRAKLQDEHLPMHEAGLTALAAQTMIGAGHGKVYAMSTAEFEAASQDRKLVPMAYPDEGTVQIECWKYAPRLLSPDGPVVDRLSLYLSLQDERDERVHGALSELLEQVRW